MTRKLTILLTEQEMLGHAATYTNGFWFVRTSSDRTMIPIYEFKCDKNLTEFINDEIFNKTDDDETSS